MLELLLNFTCSDPPNQVEFDGRYTLKATPKEKLRCTDNYPAQKSQATKMMTTFNIHCEDPWFSHIREGTKPVEGRKKTHTYAKIKVGDQINFTNGKDCFLADVTEIREYETIEKYLDDVTLEKALPGVKSVEEALAVYYQWSSEEKIRQYGFLGIFVKPRFTP
jgi:ASC-1-like (ASCH) protein